MTLFPPFISAAGAALAAWLAAAALPAPAFAPGEGGAPVQLARSDRSPEARQSDRKKLGGPSRSQSHDPRASSPSFDKHRPRSFNPRALPPPGLRDSEPGSDAGTQFRDRL